MVVNRGGEGKEASGGWHCGRRNPARSCAIRAGSGVCGCGGTGGSGTTGGAIFSTVRVPLFPLAPLMLASTLAGGGGVCGGGGVKTGETGGVTKCTSLPGCAVCGTGGLAYKGTVLQQGDDRNLTAMDLMAGLVGLELAGGGYGKPCSGHHFGVWPGQRISGPVWGCVSTRKTEGTGPTPLA